MNAAIQLSPPPAADPTELQCELAISPGPYAVATIARLLSDLSRRALESDEVGARLFVAVHELVDNTLRHSIDGRGRIQRRIRQGGERVRITLLTCNRASFESRAHLIAFFDELDASTDRDSFYRGLIHRTTYCGSPGLGLGRIYGEVAMDLSLDLNEGDDVVRLRAETSVPVTSRRDLGGMR